MFYIRKGFSILVFMNSLKSKNKTKANVYIHKYKLETLSNLYVPMGGNKSTKFKQIIAFMLSFCFISYWHGFGYDISLWGFGNFAMMVIELLFVRYFLKLSFVQAFVNIKLN